jgi:sugar (glycoside-pentoside-hexuronide) transporter
MSQPDARQEPSVVTGAPVPDLGPARKTVYALGDVTVNTALSAMGLVYTTYFLTQYAELRPVLAGLVPLVGRAVDAVSDPLMGRISDRTPWRAGRRRPYFLIGALPFGVSFALLWLSPPLASQAARFAYYTTVYCSLALSMTVLSVPYLAIQPEMAVDYDARTSLNTYRTVGSLLGVVAAVFIRPVAYAYGGGSAGFAAAGIVYGVLLALPWAAVYGVTFERRDFQTRRAETGWIEGFRIALSHRAFAQLTALYIMGRIAMDLAAALIILYVHFWLGRPEDFEPLMLLFLGSAVLALPLWLRIAQHRDKASVFIVGSLWWMTFSLILVLVQPWWPRALVFAFVPLLGIGYAVVDLMPWSMVGEVIDEDDLRTGERREGLFNGLFTFIRKLGGALGVFLVMGSLDVAGYQPGEQQTETARQAIRWLTAAGPAFFLALGVWLARGYPLTRAAHRNILAALTRRGTQ